MLREMQKVLRSVKNVKRSVKKGSFIFNHDGKEMKTLKNTSTTLFITV